MSELLSIADGEKFEKLFSNFLEGMPEITVNTDLLKQSNVELGKSEESFHEYIKESFGNFLEQTTGEPIEVKPVHNSSKISMTMQDWRLSKASDCTVSTDDKAEYSLEIEKSSDMNQVWFSLVQKNLKDIVSDEDCVPCGLTGLIEIRNGKPVVSIGIEENQNIIHVHSDTHSGVCVEPDNGIEGVRGEGGVTSYTAANSFLGQNRSAVANDIFGDWDFGELSVTDTGGWTCDGDDNWEMRVYLEDESLNKEKGVFKIKFVDQMAWAGTMDFDLS